MEGDCLVVQGVIDARRDASDEKDRRLIAQGHVIAREVASGDQTQIQHISDEIKSPMSY